MLTKFYTKSICILLAAFFLSINILSAQNETEPNDIPSQANVLALGGSINGTVSSAGDVDWFSVTTTADGQLNIVFDNSISGGLKDIALYDNDGVTMLNSSQVGNGLGGMNTNGLAPGTYYVQVYANTGTDIGAYILSSNFAGVAKANDIEPNNNIMQAQTLPLNSSTTGHLGYYYNHYSDTSDWYKIVTNADGKLIITLDNTGNPDLRTLILYDTIGGPQLSSQNVGGGVGGITYDGLAAGTYFVQITSPNPNTFATYSIKDSLAVPVRPNDIEPNNSSATALTLPLNDSAIGHIGYYYNNKRDTTDWYKITTTSDGQLDIGFDNSGNSDLKTVILYDGNGSTQLNSFQVGNGIGGGSTNQLAAGTYYMKIFGNSPTYFGPYKLSDSLEVVVKPNTNIPQPNDPEPNGSTANATVFPVNDSALGHIGYYYNNLKDTADWYQLTVPVKSRVFINLDFTGGNGAVNLNFYDASGTNLLNTTGVGNGIGGFETDSLAPGIYYVQIAEYNLYDQFGGYKLSNSFLTALPVTFTDFSGRLVNNTVSLTWQTASESNNKGFEVQKSIDGQNFSEIGFVAGHGNSSVVNNYSFIDEKTASGYNYYRLKQIDLDNNFIYSSIIKLDYLKFGWTVLGNPVNANTWLQLQLEKSSHVTIQVISMMGSVIQQNDMGTLSIGTHAIPLNLGHAAPGMYIVRLITDGQSYTQKVIK